MKRILGISCGMLLLLTLASATQATLVTIGTAQFGGAGEHFNLIWDDDNNGNSVIWLDYSNTAPNWDNQVAWASGLDTSLTYNIDSAYSVTWDDGAWRLPTTVDGPWEDGYDGTTTGGCNITTSEMGHLYYEELGNIGYFNTSGDYQEDVYGLTNTGDFNNLIASWYWSGTEYANNPDDGAWVFNMSYGNQLGVNKSSDLSGLAVRTGQVSTSPVPEPTTMLLFGTGLAGLAAVGRRRKAQESTT